MADPIVSFNGIASGVQWRDVVDQIIALQSRPIERLRNEVTLADARATAWATFRSHVQAFSDAVRGLSTGEALRVFTTSIGGVPAGFASPVASATADSNAAPGTHTVTTFATATSERVGSLTFGSRSSALGVAGEMRINGVTVQVTASDSLDSLASRLNTAGAGVTASVLATAPGQYRLVLTSRTTGEAGIDLVDGAAGVLGALGFTDGTASIKNGTSSGARSDAFADSTSPVAGLLGFSSPPAAAAVGIGSLSVTIDLATMSLDDIADAINKAPGGGQSSITAAVVVDASTGVARQRLDIRGTTSFTDANNILQSLGVLEAGRSAVAQVLAGDVLTQGGSANPASASTRLTNLGSGGSNAGVRVGDTLSISGTRGDGSTFAFDFTVNANSDTVQTLLNRLNDPVDGLKAGTRTATASIDAGGRITITDDQGGSSRLGISIVANNEGGGSLDTGTFLVTTAGLAREITAGADAEFEIDGSYFRRSSNTVSDAVAGLTITLGAAAPNTQATITVDHDVETAATAIRDFVTAYNEIANFVATQLKLVDGADPEPLYRDSVLSNMRSTLLNGMRTTVSSAIAGGLVRLSDIGIELQRDGTFKVDESKLSAALSADPDAVTHLLGMHGTSDAASLSWIFAGDAAQPGTYAVQITQAPAAADVTGAGFSGVYNDDANPDTITVRDLASGKSYSALLSDGMTTDDIVTVLNAEFGLSIAHSIAAGTALFAAGGSPAGDATTLASLQNAGGGSLGVAAGDTITISGTRHTGSAFVTSFVVTDPATQTLGELRAAVQAAAGDVDVRFVNGALTVTSNQAGVSQLTLAITSDNAGGGSLSFGAFGVQVDGRGKAKISASNAGGQLRLTHGEYGAAQGFDVSFTAGGANSTGSLGIGATGYAGIDVIGSIGGFAATGSGRILTGDPGTAVENLVVSYTGTATGSVGNITFSRGVADALKLAAKALLGTEPGSISSVTDSLGTTKSRLNDRIAALEDRIERRRQELLRRFAALEELLARAQTQSAWLSAQLLQFQPRQQ